MKTLLLFLSILLVNFNLLVTREVMAQKAVPPRVLFDFRETRTSQPYNIPLHTQKRVLSKIFPKYLTDESKCDSQFDPGGDVDVLQAARNAGQIVPAIVDMAQGSFTARGQQQTAYVISVSECNASHADNFGTKRIAIFAGDQLVADLDANFKSGIVRKTDLNIDGIDELLMVSGDMNQGILVEMAALIDFETGKVRVIEDFGTVTEDSCASGAPGSSAKASVVSLSGGGVRRFPQMRIDNYEARCRKTKRWRHISSGKME